MWCLDDIGRVNWDWVGPPAWERACFNSPEWSGGSSAVKTEPPQIVLLLLLFRTRQLERDSGAKQRLDRTFKYLSYITDQCRVKTLCGSTGQESPLHFTCSCCEPRDSTWRKQEASLVSPLSTRKLTRVNGKMSVPCRWRSGTNCSSADTESPFGSRKSAQCTLLVAGCQSAGPPERWWKDADSVGENE